MDPSGIARHHDRGWRFHARPQYDDSRWLGSGRPARRPYAPHTGVVLVDMLTNEGQPYAADGRLFLRRMVDRAAALELEVVAAFEPEWTLARPDESRWVPLDDSLCFSSHGMSSAEDVIDE